MNKDQLERELAIKKYAQALEWALENEELLNDEVIRRYVAHLRTLLEKKMRSIGRKDDAAQGRLMVGS
ncbi:MAG: hypothetical protein KGH49_04090 [Candidatus Micrarchaeota archaeon]|nr:hypothetical protein [Candidatus Micrarchaeota archaeon]